MYMARIWLSSWGVVGRPVSLRGDMRGRSKRRPSPHRHPREERGPRPTHGERGFCHLMETRPIPHPPRRVPLLGDILGMDRTAPSQGTLRQHRRLGPIYQRVIVGTKLTFVSGAELVEEINDEKRFRKH